MTKRTNDEVVKNIVDVLEEYVAPAVAGHGGVVNFVSFENGTVLLEMSGACSGCAGSTMTLKYGVERMLTQLVPEVKAVEGFDDPFSGVNPFYTSDPFGNHSISLSELEEDADESNNREV